MQNKLAALAITILLLAAPLHASLLTLSNPVADGSIITTAGNNVRTDWTGTTAFPTDPDESNATDFSAITIAHDSTNFFIRQLLYRTNNSGFMSVQEILLFDTNQSTGSGYLGPSGNLSIGAEYLLEGTSLYSFTGGANQTSFSWSFVTAVTYDDFPINDHELSFARSAIGSPMAFDFVAITDYFGAGDSYPDGAFGVSGASYTYSVQPVPEPATYGALAGLALTGLSLMSVSSRRRKRTIDNQRAAK